MIGSHLSKTGLKTLNPWTKLLLIQTFLQKRSVPKKSLARTCFLAKKPSVPPKAVLRIGLEKWGEISGTRFARPTFWLLKNHLVLSWCSILKIVRTHFAAAGGEENPPQNSENAAEPHR